MIPRILHQTWKEVEIPEKWRPLAQSWQEMHPEWEYRLWTDEDARAFVKHQYPAFLPTFDGYEYNIQRADAIRYLALDHYGGVYADLDMLCLRSLDRTLSGHSLVLTWEPDKHAQDLGIDRMLCNAFMASAPGHPFWQLVIECMGRLNLRTLSHIDVLQNTGPLMLQQVYEENRDIEITVLPSHVVSPLTAGDKKVNRCLLEGIPPEEKEQLIASGSVAVHLWSNSWVGTLAGELENPQPTKVDGFIFVQGMDSSGSDLANWGRKIPELAARCRADRRVIAFNTDGFAKYYIRPRREWRQRGFMDENEGLYIRRELGLLLRLIAREIGLWLLIMLVASRQKLAHMFLNGNGTRGSSSAVTSE